MNNKNEEKAQKATRILKEFIESERKLNKEEKKAYEQNLNIESDNE